MIKEDTNGKGKKKVKTKNSYVEKKKNMETQHDPHRFYISPPSFSPPGKPRQKKREENSLTRQFRFGPTHVRHPPTLLETERDFADL